MKKYQMVLTISCITMGLVTLGGCNHKEDKDIESPDSVTEQEASTEQETITEESPEQSEADTKEPGFAFKDVENYEFLFASGAGAWCTTLTINPDGTFEGLYHDSDMGDTGEGYPGGTRYSCRFTGTFTEPVPVNEYTYSFKIASIEYADEPGTEEILDGIKYIYSEVYGLDNAEEIYLYLPEALLAKLPEEYLGWIGQYDIADGSEDTLDCYGLYNVAMQEGFSSYEIEEDADISVEDELTSIEKQAAEIEDKIQNEALTQTQLNTLTGELYELWDMELNQIWGRLKDTLDEDTMEKLTEEERDWISNKEQKVQEAGADYEGGSMQAMIENDKAAELTKDRVYELIKYLE